MSSMSFSSSCPHALSDARTQTSAKAAAKGTYHGLGELVVHLWLEDDVTCRAGHGPLACAWEWRGQGQRERGLSARGESRRERGRTFEVDVVLVRNAEDIVALVGLYGLDEVPLRVLEVDLDASRGEQGGAKTERGGRRTQCLALAGLYQNAWQLDEH